MMISKPFGFHDLYKLNSALLGLKQQWINMSCVFNPQKTDVDYSKQSVFLLAPV